MSTYYNYDRFVFCTKEEANQIKKRVNAIDASFKGVADYDYYFSNYDESRKGLYVYECKRNSSTSDLGYLFSSYKTYYIYYNDSDCEYYTNDIDHICFPKYFIDGEEKYSDKELEQYLKGYFSQNLPQSDNPFYNLEAPNPNVNFSGFLDWCNENDYLAGLNFCVVHIIN